MNDPFLELGVSPDADNETVRRAWLARVRRFPPERDPARFEAARAAYERISTHRRRLAHALFDVEAPDVETLVALALRAGEGSSEIGDDASEANGGGASDAGSVLHPTAPPAPRRPSPERLRELLRDSLAAGAARGWDPT